MSHKNFQNVGSFIRDCYGVDLRYDEACVQIISDTEISFWSQYDECEGCKLLPTEKTKGSDAYVFKTLSPVHYAIRNETAEICNGKWSNRDVLTYLHTIYCELKYAAFLCLMEITFEDLHDPF